MRRAIFIVLVPGVMAACHGGAASNIRVGDGTRYINNSDGAQGVILPDGSHIKLSSGTTILLGKGFDLGNRVVDLDGEGMFEIHVQKGRQFVVTTKNLLIHGPGTRFRVDAVRSRPGEEVDLLDGELIIQKSYHSDLDSLAEKLSSGEMLMINREIDLMEKEKMTPDDFVKVKAKF
jgi:ferric-dicitrate binding protein FerR (iron transport regulator)